MWIQPPSRKILFCDRKESLLLHSHKILSYNLQIIFNFIKVFLLLIWNLHSLLRLIDGHSHQIFVPQLPLYTETKDPKNKDHKIHTGVSMWHCFIHMPLAFLFFQVLRKACRSFKVTKHSNGQRDGKVLDPLLLFSELLEEMQVKMTSNTISKTQVHHYAPLKIEHMMLFWLIATEIVMDTVFV